MTVTPKSLTEQVIKTGKSFNAGILTSMDHPLISYGTNRGMDALARPLTPSRIAIEGVIGRESRLLHPQMERIDPEIILVPFKLPRRS